MSSRLRIIVTGLIAQYPFGGVTWDYLQYAAGLARLGHDVFYFEDTGQWPYNPVEAGLSKDCAYNVNFLAGVMARFGLANKWAYRFPWQSQWFGLSEMQRKEVVESAELLINISGTLARPAEYRGIRRLAYIDSDPVFTQIKLANGQRDFCKIIDLHDVQFSFGEQLSPGVPSTGHTWRPTRQPVMLAEWRTNIPHRETYTTVMNWTSYNPVTYRGQAYGQKDIEFQHFLDLPKLASPAVLELAVNIGKTKRTPYDLLRHKGWRLVDPAVVCPDLDSYRNYIQSSKAEWSVAKNGYVLGQPGWSSCRSACYLAAGRPVIVEHTGFDSVLPTGKGILPFRTMEEAIAAIREVEADYSCHAKAALALAEEYFDSDKVLGRLVEQAMSD